MIAHLASGAFLAAYYGVWWRLRGGALTAMTGFDPGTGGMRAIAALGMTAPLMQISWHFAVMFPVFWITWSMAGWGAFQGMGAETSVELKNPVAFVLAKWFRLTNLSVDLWGMALEGVFCSMMISIPIELLTHRATAWCALGLLFSPLYFVAQHVRCPNLGHFAKAGSEWGEVSVGALIGVMVALELCK